MEFGAHQEHAQLLFDHINDWRANLTMNHVLITGMSGSGKTFLVKKLFKDYFHEFDCHYLNCIDFFHAESGKSERQISSMIRRGRNSIVILDNIEVVASKIPSILGHEVEHRILSVLKSSLDCVNSSFSTATATALVIGVTESMESIDRELLRSGRFGQIVHVSISTFEQRLAILKEITTITGIENDLDLKELARQTRGYTASDLKLLYSLAFQNFMERSSNQQLQQGPSYEDFINAIKCTKPSITKDLPLINKFISKTTSNLVGTRELEDKIMQLIGTSLGGSKGEALQNLKLSPIRGVLLYGPSGSGKTCLALHCAQLSGLTTIHIQATTIRSKYVGQSEKNLAMYFERARECAPCILLIDQIDALFTSRSNNNEDSTSLSSQGGSERLITCLLTELDGLTSKSGGDGVFILATTNRLKVIDPAILRSGRIGMHLPMQEFNFELRKEFILQTMQKMPLQIDKDQLEELSEKTNGMSAADLDALFREAALTRLRSLYDADNVPFELIIEQLIKMT